MYWKIYWQKGRKTIRSADIPTINTRRSMPDSFKKFIPLHKTNFMSLVYLGLGTNLGDKEQNLNNTIQVLSIEVGNVLKRSSFYASKPWGFESENDFLNAVVLVETYLSPFGLLTKTQEIERNLGRTVKSTVGYSDRLIDIDILVFDDLIIDQPTLKVPHPLIAERDFVLNPLLEVAPELIDPVSKKRFQDLILP